MATITFRDGVEWVHTTIQISKEARDMAKAKKISISAVTEAALKDMFRTEGSVILYD